MEYFCSALVLVSSEPFDAVGAETIPVRFRRAGHGVHYAPRSVETSVLYEGKVVSGFVSYYASKSLKEIKRIRVKVLHMFAEDEHYPLLGVP